VEVGLCWAPAVLCAHAVVAAHRHNQKQVQISSGMTQGTTKESGGFYTCLRQVQSVTI